MSVLFRQQRHLTLAQLERVWGHELHPKDPDAASHLSHILKLDIVNGLLDSVGEGPGFYIVTGGGIPASISGRNAAEFVQGKLASQYIVVMKEAVLDFARRREISPPSWWIEEASHSTSLAARFDGTTPGAAEGTISPPPTPPKRRGRRPTALTATISKMREDIQSGRTSLAELRDMTEKALASQCAVSRDTARKAREAILAEMAQARKAQ